MGFLRAENKHEKEYIVSVDKPITPDFLEKMAEGVKILGTKHFLVRSHSYQNMSSKLFLTQGLNRQIRRMCESFRLSSIHVKTYENYEY